MRQKTFTAIPVLLALALAVPVHARNVGAIEVGRDREKSGIGHGELVNGDFSSGRARPWVAHQPSMSSQFQVIDEEGCFLLGPNGADPWTQLYQKGLFLKANTLYRLKFDARSSSGNNLRVRIIQHGFPFENYGLVQNVNVQTRMRTFELWFTSPPYDVHDARLSFLLTPYGVAGEAYYFDNVSLEAASECGNGVLEPGESCDSGYGPLVQDGSFEAGSPNPSWEESSTQFGTPLCSLGTCGLDLAREGDWWAWFGGTAALEEGSVRQEVTLPPSGDLWLNFFIWAATCSEEATDIIEVRVDGVPIFGYDLADPDFCDLPPYSPMSLDLTPYAGQTVLLEFYSLTGTTGQLANIFVDAVSIDVDGCRGDCTFCGDGIVNGLEECEPNGVKLGGGPDCSDECRFIFLESEAEATATETATPLRR